MVWSIWYQHNVQHSKQIETRDVADRSISSSQYRRTHFQIRQISKIPKTRFYVKYVEMCPPGGRGPVVTQVTRLVVLHPQRHSKSMEMSRMKVCWRRRQADLSSCKSRTQCLWIHSQPLLIRGLPLFPLEKTIMCVHCRYCNLKNLPVDNLLAIRRHPACK